MYIKDMKPKTHWVVKVCMLFWTKEKANNEQWSETSKQNEELFMNRKKMHFSWATQEKMGHRRKSNKQALLDFFLPAIFSLC